MFLFHWIHQAGPCALARNRPCANVRFCLSCYATGRSNCQFHQLLLLFRSSRWILMPDCLMWKFQFPDGLNCECRSLYMLLKLITFSASLKTWCHSACMSLWTFTHLPQIPTLAGSHTLSICTVVNVAGIIWCFHLNPGDQQGVLLGLMSWQIILHASRGQRWWVNRSGACPNPSVPFIIPVASAWGEEFGHPLKSEYSQTRSHRN